jgi:pullulanase
MKILHFLFILLFSTQLMSQTPYPIYTGNDLGLVYTPKLSKFRVYAPTASGLTLTFYKTGLPSTDGDDGLIRSVAMIKDQNGTWKYEATGDLKGQFYTFQAKIPDQPKAGDTEVAIGALSIMAEVPDPYAKILGANGKRAMVADLTYTNPEGWYEDKSPDFGGHATDAIIYELHVRDASISPNSGIRNKGKFLGLAEANTKNTAGLSTGLTHIKELGVSHVQILPFYDYYTVDETKKDNTTYNWGYDPLNYNTPEGSYSTDAYNGVIRIKELKQMIMAMHSQGLRVVMDVVYNHTMFGKESNFHQLVPGYYHRQDAQGKFANGSGCGNETASDMPMYRKFMLESMVYWMQEYHIDGFRVDLMGLHDIETMNLISKTLHENKPDVLLYGEGWTGGTSPYPDSLRAVKHNTPKLDKIGVFSDDIRDAIKGSVFDAKDKGFVSGKFANAESVKFGIVASTLHADINYGAVNYSKTPWAIEPGDCLNYVSCHDNHTLWDRLKESNGDDNEETRIKMHQLAETIVLTSQGMPLLLAGTEFLRTKNGQENSYNSPDSINQIDWDRKTQYKSVHDYLKQIIILRRKHPAFRMPTTEMIGQYLNFLPSDLPTGMIAYTLKDKANGDQFRTILVAFNATKSDQKINIPPKKWHRIVDGDFIDQKGKTDGGYDSTTVKALSALILAEWE